MRSDVAAQTRTFERVLLLESKSEASAGVNLGDIDGDGDLDIVLAKGRHWPLLDVILRNDGKGRFTTESLSETADRTYSAALADIDGDGDLDIVVSNDRPDKKLIYKNDGKGHYLPAGTFGNPNWSTRYITMADVNGDNRPDILVANRGSIPDNPRPSQVCLNDGQGAFPGSLPLPTQSATSILAKDFDGDGFVDLFIPHRDGGQNLIFWNDGNAHFAKPAPMAPARSSVRTSASADFDGDGKLDIVFGDENEGVFFCLNEGNRTFSAPRRLVQRLPPLTRSVWPTWIKTAKQTLSSATLNFPALSFSTTRTGVKSDSTRCTGGMERELSMRLPRETLTTMAGQTLQPLALTPLTPSGSTTRNRIRTERPRTAKVLTADKSRRRL